MKEMDFEGILDWEYIPKGPILHIFNILDLFSTDRKDWDLLSHD